MCKDLTPYQRWQLENKGNILPVTRSVYDEEFEAGIEDLNRLSESIERQAEFEQYEKEQGTNQY